MTVVKTLLDSDIEKKEIKFSKMTKMHDKRLVEILKKMLEFNPKNRPTIEEILNNDLFDELRLEAKNKVPVLKTKEKLSYPDDIDKWRRNCMK